MAESSNTTYTFDLCGVDPESGLLCIRLKEADGDSGFNVCNSFVIYQFLESRQTNQYDGRKIIEQKEKDGLVFYHFHFGLKILDDSFGNFPIPYADFESMSANQNKLFGSVFYNALDFSQVTFAGEVRFVCADFQGQANFSYTGFPNGVSFKNSTFECEVDFSGKKFKEKANFAFATFHEDVFLLTQNLSKRQVLRQVFFVNTHVFMAQLFRNL